MIHSFLVYLCGADNGAVDRTAFWTAVSALLTGCAGIVALTAIGIAYKQIKEAGKTARADFEKRFVDSFFTTETRTLFTLLMNSGLTFEILDIVDKNGKKIDYLPIFRIDLDVARQLGGMVQIESNRTAYSAFEMDDLVLGHFDDIGWYERQKLIDIEAIHGTFGYHITTAYQSEAVQKYLTHPDNAGKYVELHRLVKRLPK